MGHDHEQDGFTHVADVDAVPALAHIGTWHAQPPQAQQAPLHVHNQQDTMLGNLTVPQNLTRSREPRLPENATTVQASGGRAPLPDFRSPADVQISGGFEYSSVTQPPTGYESYTDSEFFAIGMTLPATRPTPLAPLSTMPQPLTAASAPGSTTGTAPSTVSTPTRTSTTRRQESSHSVQEFANYPPSSQPLPAGLSRQQFCQNYPNHLRGRSLLRVHYGQGDEEGLWNGHDMWRACPTDGKHNNSYRPQNYLEHELARTKKEASSGSQAEQRSGKAKRSRESSTNDVEQEEEGPAPKRPRPAEGADSSVLHGSQRAVSSIVPHPGHHAHTFSARQDTNITLGNYAGRRFVPQPPEEAATVHIDRSPRSFEFPQPALPQPQTSREPMANASSIAQAGQSTRLSGRDLFIATLNAETRYQHHIIYQRLSLLPQARVWSEDAKHDYIREIWRSRFSQWEKSVEQKYGVQAGLTPEGQKNPLDLLVKVCRKIAPPPAPFNDENFQQYIEKAKDISTKKFLSDLKLWRNDFVRMFADGLPFVQSVPGTAIGHERAPIDHAAEWMGNGSSKLATDGSGSALEAAQAAEADVQDFARTLSEGQDAVQQARSQQSEVDVSVPNRSNKGQEDDELSLIGDPVPQMQADTPEQVNQYQAPLGPIEHEDDLEDLFEDAGDERARNPSEGSRSQNAVEQSEAAELDTDEEAAAYNDMLAQDDDDEQPAPMIFPSDGAHLRPESMQSEALDDSVSSAFPKPAKRSKKLRARRDLRHTSRAAAAPARPAPSEAEIQAEVQAETSRRMSMEEEALRKAEELDADREWLKTQKIRSHDGQEWPVTASDIPLFVASYLGSSMPETANNAKAAVKWHQNGCPGVKDEHTENAKQRKQREKREKREEKERLAQLRAERGDE